MISWDFGNAEGIASFELAPGMSLAACDPRAMTSASILKHTITQLSRENGGSESRGDAMNRANMLSIRMAPLSDIHLGSSYQVPSMDIIL